MGLIKKVSNLIHGRRSNEAKTPDEEQAAGLELGPYAPPASHEPITPTFPVPCLQPEAHKSSYIAPTPFAASESVKIRVIIGTGPAKQTWLIDKELLCSFSEYFRGALRNDRFTEEAFTGQCILPDDDPDSFRNVVEWLHLKDCCKTDVSSDHLCRKEQNPGGDLPEKSFVAADRFIMRLYCRFLLSHFIQDIESIGAERLQFVAQNPITTVSIWRFARHWVAHLIFVQKVSSKDLLQEKEDEPKKKLGKKRSKSKQYLQLAGQGLLVRELGLEDAGWASTDPRKYELDHWLEKCSQDIHADCEHRILRGVEGPKPEGLHERRDHWMMRPMATVIYLGPIVIIALASYVQSRDYLDLIQPSTKVVSILTGISMFGCVAHPIFGIISPLIGVVNAIMSTMSVKSCFPAANAAAAALDICQVEAGLTALVWLWVVTFLGLVYAV